MKRVLQIFLIVILAVQFAHAVENVKALIAEGDSLYHIFDNEAAKAKYLIALKEQPGNADILWRISRTEVDIGEHLAKDAQEQRFQEALLYADSSIAVDPSNQYGHLRRAIALGRIALFKGVFKSVSLVKQIKNSLDECLKIDPDEPTAHYVLARTHAKLCEKPKIARKILGLGWADRQIADTEYRKAIELDSSFIMYRLDYAKLLLEMGKCDRARIQLMKIEELPIIDEDDPDFKIEAEELLKNL